MTLYVKVHVSVMLGEMIRRLEGVKESLCATHPDTKERYDMNFLREFMTGSIYTSWVTADCN